nr:MAG TPA: hypothetical protein [Caudoviricetes sp.]
MPGAETKQLVGRHKRLAFMEVTGTGSSTTLTRMTGFTSLSEGKEATEYSRQYVDEATERTDVVGYATSIDYEFDRYTNDPVCERLSEIADDELVGTDAQVNIVSVDIFTEDTQKRAIARKRTYSVIPDTTGDGTDALIYSGSFSAASEITKGYATSEDNWQTCTFTEGEIPES